MCLIIGRFDIDSFRGKQKQRLDERKDQNLFREQHTILSRQGSFVEIEGRSLVNFSSNDYLGLAMHAEIISAFKAGSEVFGVGSSSSAMICGRSDPHRQLEEKIARKTGREAALVFPSGYMANMAAVTSFVGRSDAVFLDRLAHASLIDAARLSGAKLSRYQHADPGSLDLALKKSSAKVKLVLTDGVFSMDGDKAPLKDLAETCKQHGAVLLVDDAHGFGTLGITGGGLLEENEITPGQAPLLVATFGKALGTAGAFVAADKIIIEALIQFGRSYIYTTAQPPALARATLASLGLLEKETWRRKKLHGLVSYFRARAKSMGIEFLRSETAIQPLVIGNTEKALRISKDLLKAGFLVSAIRPPTVPNGSSRLRITLTASHAEDQVDDLLDTLGALL